MTWSPERKREAAVGAPLGRDGLERDDTRFVESATWFQTITPSASYLNDISFSKLSEDEADAAIDDAIATYHPLGKPVKWYVGPWTEPSDFGDRLARRGFESWEGRAMGCASTLACDAPSEIEAFEVDDASLEAYVAAMNHGWGVPPGSEATELTAHRRAFAKEPRRLHSFGAKIGGDWAGTAALIVREDYGYLLGTQVFETSRGRGAYRALVAIRLAHLRARGIDYAVTHAMESTSAPILAHLGFETILRFKCFFLPPGSGTKR